MASSSLGPVMFPDRKLSVAATLDQATKALAAHRAWMRRRVQQGPASSSSRLDTLPPGDGGEGPERRPASWALGTVPTQGKGELECPRCEFMTPPHTAPAPPPSAPAAGQGQSSSTRRVGKNQVFPSGHPPRAKGGAWLEGEEPGERSKGHFYAAQNGEIDVEGDRLLFQDMRAGAVGESHRHHGYKKFSRSRVTPVHTHHSDADTPPLHARPKSPGVFLVRQDGEPEEGEEEKEEETERSREEAEGVRKKLPPLPSVRTAWGSQPSLHRGPSGKGSADEQDGLTGTVPNSRGQNDDRSGAAGSGSKRGLEPHPLQTVTTKRDVPAASGHASTKVTTTRDTPSSGSSTASQATSLHHPPSRTLTSSQQQQQQSDQSSNPCAEEHLDSDSSPDHTHVHSPIVRGPGPAAVLTVSPAPREQRASYATQGLSKLSLAESSGRSYTPQHATPHGGRAPPTTLTMEAHWLGRERRKTTSELTPVNPELVNVDSSARDEVDRSPLEARDSQGALSGDKEGEEEEEERHMPHMRKSAEVPSRELPIHEVLLLGPPRTKTSSGEDRKDKGQTLFVAPAREKPRFRASVTVLQHSSPHSPPPLSSSGVANHPPMTLTCLEEAEKAPPSSQSLGEPPPGYASFSFSATSAGVTLMSTAPSSERGSSLGIKGDRQPGSLEEVGYSPLRGMEVTDINVGKFASDL